MMIAIQHTEHPYHIGDGWANMEDEFPYDSGEWSDYDGLRR